MRFRNIAIPAVIVAVVAALSTVFVVDEREKALVLQFGRVVAVRDAPGLYFKIPLIQEVVRYDDRILSRDIDPIEVTPLDDRRLVVDAFALYRISDLLQFRAAVGPGGIPFAESRLDGILRNDLRRVLGSVTSSEILSADREKLMAQIRDGAMEQARALGLEIIDVRLKRTDLPRQNLDATFARMRAEREREATDERARGREAAQRIRAQADRTVTELVSDSRRKAEIIQGEADAERIAVFAKAYSADREFFEFYRSLGAYEKALKAENSTLVLSPDSEFFDYFRATTTTRPQTGPQAAPTGGRPVSGASASGPEPAGATEGSAGQ